MAVAYLSSAWINQFRRRICRWYDLHRRDLPWRQTSDAYAIWISETMLQQTQVATVVDYYRRFMQRFPTATALAQAQEDEVLELWAGLGYYRRARQLHAAAGEISERFAGEFPDRFEDVLSLPGIGRYTAGAIMSIAFDARAPIVEANTARLYSRLLALREPLTSRAAQQTLWDFAQAILPKRSGSGRLNQATMELGSQICRPLTPNCQECPLRSLCPTFNAGLISQIPAASPKKLITPTSQVTVLIERGDRLLMRRNQAGEWWQGLWDFPKATLDDDTSNSEFDPRDPASRANLRVTRYAMRRAHALECEPWAHAKTIHHSVTRYRIALHCFYARMADDSLEGLGGDWRWVDKHEPIALCAPAQRLRHWLNTDSADHSSSTHA